MASGFLLLLVSAALAFAAPDWTDCPSPCHCKWSSGKKTALCRDGGLVALPHALDSDMQVLDLSGNSIPRLARDAFKNAGLINLQRIFLRNAGLKTVDRDAFRDLIILVEVDLSGNEIEELQPDTFLGNERLRVINLNGNPIRELKQAQFPPLPHLRTLEMEGCRLELVHRNAFVYLASLETLNLKSNRLRSLSETAFLNFAHLKSLELHGNPWRCDCNLRGFRDWFLTSKLHSDPLVCAEPDTLAGLTWQNVAPEDFACPPNVTLSLYPQVQVEAGGNVTLGCRITGDPEPEVTWLFDGKPATSNSTVVSSEEGVLDKWVNISVVNVSDADAGVYTCLARNSPDAAVGRNVTLVLPEVVTATTVSKSDAGLVMWIVVSVGCAVVLSVVCGAFAVVCVKVRAKKRKNKSMKSSVSFTDQEKKLLDVSIATTTDRGTGSCEAISTEMELSEPPVHITIESEPLPLTVYPPPPEFSTSVLPAGAYGNILISVSVSRDPTIDASRCPDLLDLPHRAGKSAVVPYPGMVTLPRRPRAALQYDNMGPRITAGGSSTLSLPDTGGEVAVPPPPPPPLQTPQCTPLTSEFVSL